MNLSRSAGTSSHLWSVPINDATYSSLSSHSSIGGGEDDGAGCGAVGGGEDSVGGGDEVSVGGGGSEGGGEDSAGDGGEGGGGKGRGGLGNSLGGGADVDSLQVSSALEVPSLLRPRFTHSNQPYFLPSPTSTQPVQSHPSSLQLES